MRVAKTFVKDEDRITNVDEIISKNNLKLVRSQQEIFDRFKQKQENVIDFELEVLVDYLSFSSASVFLSERVNEELVKGEREWVQIVDLEEAVQDFLDYLVFAYGKAYDQRGLSAGRSIQKLSAWLWLLGRDDLVEIINKDSLYNPYGAPALIAVTEKLGLVAPVWLVEFAKQKVEE